MAGLIILLFIIRIQFQKEHQIGRDRLSLEFHLMDKILDYELCTKKNKKKMKKLN
jgi:hypothetical protein